MPILLRLYSTTVIYHANSYAEVDLGQVLTLEEMAVPLSFPTSETSYEAHLEGRDPRDLEVWVPRILKANPSLTGFEIWGQVRDSFLQILLGAPLRRLRHRKPGIASLGAPCPPLLLTSLRVDPRGGSMKSLGQALATAPALKRLVFTRKLTAEQRDHLEAGLVQCPGLETLEFRKMTNNSSFPWIARILSGNPHIQKLGLRMSKYSEGHLEKSCFSSLRDVLPSRGLRELDLGFCLSAEEVEDLGKFGSASRLSGLTLRYVDFLELEGIVEMLKTPGFMRRLRLRDYRGVGEFPERSHSRLLEVLGSHPVEELELMYTMCDARETMGEIVGLLGRPGLEKLELSLMFEKEDKHLVQNLVRALDSAPDLVDVRIQARVAGERYFCPEAEQVYTKCREIAERHYQPHEIDY